MKKLIIVLLANLFVQATPLSAQTPGVVISNKEGWA